jgi:hypothetical protein
MTLSNYCVKVWKIIVHDYVILKKNIFKKTKKNTLVIVFYAWFWVFYSHKIESKLFHVLSQYIRKGTM